MHCHETSDLGLATTLSCLEFRLARIDRKNPRRAVFCFEGEKAELDLAITSYWDRSLRLSPVDLFAQQKLLKHRIYDEV